ncbi:MAG: hypothetical protein R2709_11930 [Marmoricola sp.]
MRARLGGIDLGLLVAAIEDGASITTGEQVTAGLLAGLASSASQRCTTRSVTACTPTPQGERASAIKVGPGGALPGRKVAKDTADGAVVYGDLSRPDRHSARCGRYRSVAQTRAPPVDLAEALNAIGEDVMAGYNPGMRCGVPPQRRRTTAWP